MRENAMRGFGSMLRTRIDAYFNHTIVSHRACSLVTERFFSSGMLIQREIVSR